MAKKSAKTAAAGPGASSAAPAPKPTKVFLRFRALAATAAVVVVTLTQIMPVLRDWHPPRSCAAADVARGAQALDDYQAALLAGIPPPALPDDVAIPGLTYAHFGLPFFDDVACSMTQFFYALAASPLNIGLPFGMETIGVMLAFLLMAGIERTRANTRFPASSFSLIGMASQFIGASIAIPLLWFVPWLLSNPVKTSGSSAAARAARPSHLGSSIQIHFIGAGVLIFGVFGVAMTSVSVLPYAFVFFQYMPAFLPLFFGLSRYFSGPRPANHRTVSSATAVAWYSFGQIAIGFPDIIALINLGRLLITPPSGNDVDGTSGFEFLIAFITRPYADRPVSELPIWFIMVELASLTAIGAIWVASELGPFDTVKYLFNSVISGPGAALLGAAVAREKKLENAISAEEPTPEGETKKEN
ncbi:hypothetical protein HK405_010274 [Cladochytrium tenue]|nr:hypothetical protein HK405_010274 [Cladochytrium tenue]